MRRWQMNKIKNRKNLLNAFAILDEYQVRRKTLKMATGDPNITIFTPNIQQVAPNKGD